MRDDQSSQMVNKLQTCKERNAVIQKKLISIFGKFERLMQHQGRAHMDTQTRDMLLEA